MDFSDYYNLRNKKYEFRIKIAMCDMNEDVKSKIESGLVRYEVEGGLTFKKTPIQENPLDFPNIKNSEVYIADLVSKYPVTPSTLVTTIANSAGLSVANIAVFNKTDPRLADEEAYKERKADDFKDKYKTAFGNDYEPQEKTKYGQELVDDELEKAATRKKQRDDNVVTNKLIPKQTLDHSTATGIEQGRQGTDSPLTNVSLSKLIPNKKQTLFSKE